MYLGYLTLFLLSMNSRWTSLRGHLWMFGDREKIYLMPAGENQELLNENKQRVVELAKDKYLNFTTRLHIEIWNKKTGV